MVDAYEIIRRQVINEVFDAITSKHDAIMTLLSNGMPLLGTTSGERFDKLYDKRRKLWSKIETLNETRDLVYDLM